MVSAFPSASGFRQPGNERAARLGALRRVSYAYMWVRAHLRTSVRACSRRPPVQLLRRHCALAAAQLSSLSRTDRRCPASRGLATDCGCCVADPSHVSEVGGFLWGLRETARWPGPEWCAYGVWLWSALRRPVASGASPGDVSPPLGPALRPQAPHAPVRPLE